MIDKSETLADIGIAITGTAMLLDTMKTVYIFADVGGWYACDNGGPLDIGGRCYPSKNAAIAAARRSEQWTHYIVAGTKRRAKFFGRCTI